MVQLGTMLALRDRQHCLKRYIRFHEMFTYKYVIAFISFYFFGKNKHFFHIKGDLFLLFETGSFL